MGCDIHFYVEKHVGGRWVTADAWKPSEYGDYMDCEEMYRDRCYNLFAILADVRNGYGFAGCETGKGFTVIAQPRGLPSDMSPELSEYAHRMLEHTPSWLTL